MVDQEDLPIKSELRDRLRTTLCLGSVQGESVDDIQLVTFQLECESGFQGSAEHFTRQGVFVVAGFRPHRGTTLSLKRVSDFSDPGSAGPLLLPGLSAAAMNF